MDTNPINPANPIKKKKTDILTPAVIAFLAIGAFMFVWWLAVR